MNKLNNNALRLRFASQVFVRIIGISIPIYHDSELATVAATGAQQRVCLVLLGCLLATTVNSSGDILVRDGRVDIWIDVLGEGKHGASVGDRESPLAALKVLRWHGPEKGGVRLRTKVTEVPPHVGNVLRVDVLTGPAVDAVAEKLSVLSALGSETQGEEGSEMELDCVMYHRRGRVRVAG